MVAVVACHGVEWPGRPSQSAIPKRHHGFLVDRQHSRAICDRLGEELGDGPPLQGHGAHPQPLRGAARSPWAGTWRATPGALSGVGGQRAGELLRIDLDQLAPATGRRIGGKVQHRRDALEGAE